MRKDPIHITQEDLNRPGYKSYKVVSEQEVRAARGFNLVAAELETMEEQARMLGIHSYKSEAKWCRTEMGYQECRLRVVEVPDGIEH